MLWEDPGRAADEPATLAICGLRGLLLAVGGGYKENKAESARGVPMRLRSGVKRARVNCGADLQKISQVPMILFRILSNSIFLVFASQWGKASKPTLRSRVLIRQHSFKQVSRNST